MTGKKIFNLYVVRPEDIGPKEKYYLITPRWTLLYTNRKPPERNKKITDTSSLPSIAVEWLTATIDEIRMEHLRDNAQEILARGKAFNERFEEELKKERAKMEAEDDQNGG